MFFAPVIGHRARTATPTAFDRGFGRSVDRHFNRFLDEAFFGPAAGNRAAVQEDEKSWTLTLDLPGVSREDLSISAEGAVVRIETREQAPRRYRAVYELPQDIDVDATGAKLEHGVLTLKLAKQAPASRAREIRLD